MGCISEASDSDASTRNGFGVGGAQIQADVRVRMLVLPFFFSFHVFV
jgi:hypothetical protein